MDDKTRLAMLKIIEDKKRKSSSQKNQQRVLGKMGNAPVVHKQHKKGGLFDK